MTEVGVGWPWGPGEMGGDRSSLSIFEASWRTQGGRKETIQAYLPGDPGQQS